MKKLVTINCPICGRQYLPGEIFIPDYLIGKPKNIERDIYGAIIDFDGVKPEITENYTCDGCNTTFKVKALISFKVDVDDKNNFSKDYVTQLNKPTLFLSEQ